MSINYKEFIHPSDKTAMEALRKIPGFNALTKKFMNIIGEKIFKIESTSSYIKLGPNQMPRIYNILVKVCERLKIKTPELYLKLDRDPNAYTYGDSDIFIVIHSGLIETMSEEQIETVLAHECGHILCHHTLYRTMGTLLLNGATFVVNNFIKDIVTSAVLVSIQYAMAYWMRCSEFSADRVSAYYHNSPEPVVDVMLALSGATSNLNEEINRDEFLAQAKDYKVLVDSSAYNKAIEVLKFGMIDHPLNVYRAYEIVEFYKKNKELFSQEYDVIDSTEDPYLPDVKAKQKYNIRIWYEYIKPKKFIKMGGIFDNEPLNIKIAEKEEKILKNSLADLYIDEGTWELVVWNSHSESSFIVPVNSNKALIVSWDSELQSFSIKDK